MRSRPKFQALAEGHATTKIFFFGILYILTFSRLHCLWLDTLQPRKWMTLSMPRKAASAIRGFHTDISNMPTILVHTNTNLGTAGVTPITRDPIMNRQVGPDSAHVSNGMTHTVDMVNIIWNITMQVTTSPFIQARRLVVPIRLKRK